jgi:hypothetical protein
VNGATENMQKFEPFASAVEPVFWKELARKKLEEFMCVPHLFYAL